MEKDIINILIVDDEKYEGILIEKCVTMCRRCSETYGKTGP